MIDEHVWNRREEILFKVEMSVIYHRKRERFFELWDRTAKAISVIGGSAAFARLGGEDALPYVAALITITSTLALVGSFSDRARRHAELARQFCELESDIRSKGERGFSEDEVNRWDARVGTIEAGEPATLGALVRICSNQVRIARGQKPVHLPLAKRLLAQYVDFRLAPE